MATLYKRDRSPFWYCAYFAPDGKRLWRSTGEIDRKKAEAVARTWDKAIVFGAAGSLTPEKAREIIAAGVADDGDEQKRHHYGIRD